MPNVQQRFELLKDALKFLGDSNEDRGPVGLYPTLQGFRILHDIDCDENCLHQILVDSTKEDPNEPARRLFGKYLRRWDSLTDAAWVDGTDPLTRERRHLIYDKLDLPETYREHFDRSFPLARSDALPIIIAKKHEPWYSHQLKTDRSFYWGAYHQYLANQAGWPDESILRLDEASTLVLERLSDPERPEIYATKGLVVGYVQSGKTANFTAVAAKAADAGYRLIIILAGTLNILRAQTQRRIDKELVGREILLLDGPNADYINDPDWEEFISHGGIPSEIGAFDWTRLTGADVDYQSLKKGIEALEQKPAVQGRRFNDPVNLHAAPARLIIMKKIPSVLEKLNTDLRRLRTHLEEVPCLIIDDESDQASVNTRKPSSREEKQRTKTNDRIVTLVGLLPRAQYIGYTATPFANVFIDPGDVKDLFPKDYIIALGRPTGYMGVSDFFDLGEDGIDLAEDEKPTGFLSKERAFIRNVKDPDESDSHLPKAIRSFLLAGAIKLYRKDKNYDVACRHHTMLIHRSTKQLDHEQDADLVMRLYDREKVGSPSFYDRMKSLWDEDYNPVSRAQAPNAPRPSHFDELVPYIDKCVSKVQLDQAVRIVNGDNKYADQLPNFDRDQVWSILVGGTKLSRGYTVEGLTVSYYRRRVRTADTLMQVGRWFGFRRGFKDLVRLFIGRSEPDGRNRTMDLYETFKAICRDEELFRKELRKYSDKRLQPPLRPDDVPPMVPSHYLPPTARNKMYSAGVCRQNFSGVWKERVSPNDKRRKENASLVRDLISKDFRGKFRFGFDDSDGKRVEWSGSVAKVKPSDMIVFLDNYSWTDDQRLMIREKEFLEGEGDWDPEIDQWVIVLPHKASAADLFWRGPDAFSVFVRARAGSVNFKVFSERRHRMIASHIAGVERLDGVTPDTEILRKPKTGIMLCYPTVDTHFSSKNAALEVSDADITMGFGLQFPRNHITVSISYTVDSRR